MHCNECGAFNPVDAKFCGSCGKAIGSQTDATSPRADVSAKRKSGGCMKAAGIGAAVVVGLAILGSIVGPADTSSNAGNGSGVDRPASAGTEATETPEPAPEPALKVTAAELFAAYEANEAAAQQQYGGQALEVSGTVSGVDLDFMDKPVVQLATSNQFMSAQANLVEEDQPRASSLSKGQSIVLRCASVGEVIGTPMLQDCRFL